MRDLSFIPPPLKCFHFAVKEGQCFGVRQGVARKFKQAAPDHFARGVVVVRDGRGLGLQCLDLKAMRCTAWSSGALSGKVQQVARVEAVVAVRGIVNVQHEGDGCRFE